MQFFLWGSRLNDLEPRNRLSNLAGTQNIDQKLAGKNCSRHQRDRPYSGGSPAQEKISLSPKTTTREFSIRNQEEEKPYLSLEDDFRIGCHISSVMNSYCKVATP